MSVVIKSRFRTGLLFVTFQFSLIAHWSNDPSEYLTV